MSLDLDTDVRAELDRRRGEWKQIAADAKVSHSWISQFVRGKIPNPGHQTLKNLALLLGLAGRSKGRASNSITTAPPPTADDYQHANDASVKALQGATVSRRDGPTASKEPRRG